MKHQNILALLFFSGTLILFVCKPAENSGELLLLEGSPLEMGRQHGSMAREAIRTMVGEYIGSELVEGRLNPEAQARIERMKPSLPTWYLEELRACSEAAGIDADALLYAQCEGDIRSLPGCTTYVAFGEATPGGRVEMGRNFDYGGLTSTESCVRAFLFRPTTAGHHAFISIGWAGILGGWTFYNEKGLFVANNLGGFGAKNSAGIPTLILERILAERAATVEEAIEMIRTLPRMRGQAIVLGHAGNLAKGISPSSALVLYDAERVEVQRPTGGFLFHSSVGTEEEALRAEVLAERTALFAAIRSTGSLITLHSVAIDPANQILWLAHGTRPSAHNGGYSKIDLGACFTKP